jgi:hypothetical protein
MTNDLHDLWHERQQVGAALDSGSLTDDDPAWERFPDLDQAIREARPTHPAGLAIQTRLLADQFAAIGHVADEKLALRIAAALEKLDPPGQNATLTRGAGRGACRRVADQLVIQAAALVWTINIWAITFRASWLCRRAAPARRPAASGAHRSSTARTACVAFLNRPAHATGTSPNR